MILFESIGEIESMQDGGSAAIAVGNFDGVHRGHQSIIRRMVSNARIAGYKSAVFTFSNHPRNMLKTGEPVKNILYREDKIRLIQEMGVDWLFQIPFDSRIRTMTPEEYVDQLLIRRLHMREIFCGFNYRYGYRAAGNVRHLLEMGLTREFSVHIMAPFKVEGHVVSSTMIREMISRGEVDRCRAYLGRCYSIGGEVVVGNKLGRTLGFPTSNLSIDETMVTPPNGVYVTYCIYNGQRYPSITNVGVRPTIGTFKKNVETHIFHFDKELYGKQIRVEFLKKTRDEIKFESREALSRQITEDCIRAKAFHRQQTGKSHE